MPKWLDFINSLISPESDEALERRHADRLFAPPCPNGHPRERMRPAVRTKQTVQFECMDCKEIVFVNKPKS